MQPVTNPITVCPHFSRPQSRMSSRTTEVPWPQGSRTTGSSRERDDEIGIGPAGEDHRPAHQPAHVPSAGKIHVSCDCGYQRQGRQHDKAAALSPQASGSRRSGCWWWETRHRSDWYTQPQLAAAASMTLPAGAAQSTFLQAGIAHRLTSRPGALCGPRRIRLCSRRGHVLSLSAPKAPRAEAQKTQLLLPSDAHTGLQD
jgi:hypothetical protein